jgi:hypothetical protein
VNTGDALTSCGSTSLLRSTRSAGQRKPLCSGCLAHGTGLATCLTLCFSSAGLLITGRKVDISRDCRPEQFTVCGWAVNARSCPLASNCRPILLNRHTRAGFILRAVPPHSRLYAAFIGLCPKADSALQLTRQPHTATER